MLEKKKQEIFHNFIDQDPNDNPAKVAGGRDKLTNRSQLLAAFGWWRVLIFSSGKKQLCNL